MIDDDLFTFSARTRARTEDPDTSKAAAAKIVGRLNSLQQQVADVFAQEQYRRGLTQFELEEICGFHGSTYRTRISELERLGMLVRYGTRRISRSRDPKAEREVWYWHAFHPAPQEST